VLSSISISHRCFPATMPDDAFGNVERTCHGRQAGAAA
jgi:hypothetical protein